MAVFETERLDALEDKVDGVFLGMEAGFRDVRKDQRFQTQLYVPLVLVTLTALVLAILALVFTVENRSLILQIQYQVAKNQQNIENMLPIIMQPYSPVPSEK